MAKPIKCQKCGRENDPTFAYCLDCGDSLRHQKQAPAVPTPAAERPRICSKCGEKIQPNFAFCGYCGTPVAAAAPPSREASRTDPVVPASEPMLGTDPGQPVVAAPVKRPSVLELEALTPPEPMRSSPTPAPAPIPLATQPDPIPLSTPAPSAKPRPKLTAMRPDGQPGMTYTLARDETVCGRTTGALLLPDDPTISPKHARLTLRAGKLFVEDLGSVNGTFLRLRSPRPLHHGDEIRIGRQLLRYEPLPKDAHAGEEGVSLWGSPNPGYQARFAQLLEGGGLGEIFPLQQGENVVGREVGEVSFPGDGFVSGRIEIASSGATLADSGSSNGTFVKLTVETEIAAGDQILVGMQLLRVDSL
jgi:hypothetical protein